MNEKLLKAIDFEIDYLRQELRDVESGMFTIRCNNQDVTAREIENIRGQIERMEDIRKKCADE